MKHLVEESCFAHKTVHALMHHTVELRDGVLLGREKSELREAYMN